MQSEERQEIAAYLEGLVKGKIREKNIKAILVNPLYHGQPKRRIEIGHRYADLEPGAPSEQVVAIFESTSFLVCTPNRGAGKGLPFFFTREEVIEVEECV